jgi:hypothetical protein
MERPSNQCDKKANAQLHPMQKEMSKFGYPFWTTLKIPVWL